MRNFYDLDPDTQRRAAARRLLRYLKHYVEPYHPFLRRLYREAHVDLRRIRTIEDFQQLPVVEKKHLRADPLMFILRPGSPGAPALPDGYDTADLRKSTLLRYAAGAALNLPRDPSRLVRQESLRERIRRRAMLEWLPIHTHASSGSSGEPVPVTFSHHDISTVMTELANLAIKAKRPAPGYLALEWDERKMSIFPGAPHMAFYSPLLIKVLSGAPSFETFGGNVISTERQISIFVNGGFHTLIAVPSYLLYWLRTALTLQREGKVGGLKTLKRVVLGAEPVSEALREHLRELAVEAGAHPGMKIIQTLGMTEMKWSFFECAERSGIHLNPRYFYWELLHPDTRQPVGPREPGVLVFTHIGWRGTVLVRYWTGDLVKGGMVWDRCELCGWTFPRIFPPICRVEQDFTKIKGALVDLSVLIEVIRDTPGVRNFQVSLENEGGGAYARDQLIVTLVPEPGVDPDALHGRVVDRIKHGTEVSPDLVIFEPDEALLEKRLFARKTVKAEYVVERRVDRQ